MSEFSLTVSANLPGWLEHRDPRARLITMLLAVLATIALNQLAPLLMMLVVALTLALIARINWRIIAKRLLAFEGFMLMVLLFLPFTYPGETLTAVFGMTISWQGIERALVIILRGNAVVLTVLVLIGTLEPVTLGHAMARLGVPKKLVNLLLMTIRYISVLFAEYTRLRTAMTARGFKPQANLHTWRSYGWLIGMLLVRSMDRAQRVRDAMRCRGFNGHFHLLSHQHWKIQDSLFLIAAAIIGSIPLIWQIWL